MLLVLCLNRSKEGGLFYQNLCFVFSFELSYVNFQISKMECQVQKNDFNQICAVYGQGAITERTASDWFDKFKNGNSYLKVAPCACSSPFNSWTQATISLPNRYWRRKMVSVH